MTDKEIAETLLVLADTMRRQYKVNTNFKISIEAMIQSLKETVPNFEQRFHHWVQSQESETQNQQESDPVVTAIEKIIQSMIARLKSSIPQIALGALQLRGP
jgi:hypothetical protein